MVFTCKNNIKKTIVHPEKLVNRFYTEDLSRDSKNTGLGLYIASEFVKKHSGDLSIKTNNDTFAIKIII